MECFEWEVYYGIIGSMALMALVIGLYRQSFKAFLTTFWSYSAVILSDCYTIPLNTVYERLLSGVWLLVCTVLLSAFSGQLREGLMRPKPIYWIDSIEELHELEEWKDKKIQTFSVTEYANFIENNGNTTMAQDFSKRTDYLQVDDKVIKNGLKLMKEFLDIKGVIKGQVAVVYPFHYLQVIKLYLTDVGLEEDIDFHISSVSTQPFYTLINKQIFNENHTTIWDNV